MSGEPPLFPTRLTPFIKKMLPRSAAFRKQYLFSSAESDDSGVYKPWHGVFDTGIAGLERMYVDRCVLLPVNTCPAYCRFCVRKDYLAPAGKSVVSQESLRLALEYIQNDSRILDVLISGGEAILDLRRLFTLLDSLGRIDHVRVVRIATRCVAYDPERISKDFLNGLARHRQRFGSIRVSQRHLLMQ